MKQSTSLKGWRTLKEWGKEHARAAQLEGWDIFESVEPDYPPFELQAIVSPKDWDRLPYNKPIFVDENGDVSDLEAWRHVLTQAREGSELHVEALGFLRDNSPEEYEHIIEVRLYDMPIEEVVAGLRMIKEDTE